MAKIFAFLLLCGGLVFGQGTTSPAAMSGAEGGASSPTALRAPLFLGAALGFGSGTGVGTDRGLGLRQIEPMIGLWYPGMGFARIGYGFFDYNESSENKENYEVEHSDFDVEVGIHLFGLLYAMGTYSRVKELSDLGDVAWNEWGAGFGTVLSFFAKSLLFAEVEYRWVLDHYDPFQDKSVDGSRLQFNIGFVAYVF